MKLIVKTILFGTIEKENIVSYSITMESYNALSFMCENKRSLKDLDEGTISGVHCRLHVTENQEVLISTWPSHLGPEWQERR